MENYSEVIGLPVICVDNGSRIGIVKDVIFNPCERKVVALLLERRGCQIWKKIILLKDVLSMGKDAVVVNDCTCMQKMLKHKNTDEFKCSGRIKGLKVYSKSGNDLGVVEDILFDYSTGSIEGVEVSDGLIQDIVRGRSILPLFGKVEIGEEIMLVDREAIEEMTDTGGGLKKILLGDKEGRE